MCIRDRIETMEMGHVPSYSQLAREYEWRGFLCPHGSSEFLRLIFLSFSGEKGFSNDYGNPCVDSKSDRPGSVWNWNTWGELQKWACALDTTATSTMTVDRWLQRPFITSNECKPCEKDCRNVRGRQLWSKQICLPLKSTYTPPSPVREKMSPSHEHFLQF